MSDETEQEGTVHPLVNEILMLVDDMLSNRDEVIEGLNAEIELVQARFTVLSAIRDSLLPDNAGDESDCSELPLADADDTSVDDHIDLESKVTKHIREFGPSLPGAVAELIGVHSTVIGRMVNKSSVLAKKYITGKGNCIVLKD